MNPGYLVLYPATSSDAPQPEVLLGRLRDLGLIGQRESGREHRYRTGNAFLRLITYLGCSPSIPLSGDSEGEHCHLQLVGPYSTPTLISGSNSRPPRCPHCRHPVKDWQAWLENEQTTPTRCPACAETTGLEHFEWREQAGVGRLFLLISHVFPGEAVPVETLMRTLRKTGDDWHYAYVQQPRLWHAEGGWAEI